MMAVSLGSAVPGPRSLQSAVELVWAHPQVVAEVRELIKVLTDHIDHLHPEGESDLPLQIHARYTRLEILAALGEGNAAQVPPWRERVYDAKVARADVLAFTLDKTSGDFSPTTAIGTTPSAGT
jgi:hypothetical protein